MPRVAAVPAIFVGLMFAVAATLASPIGFSDTVAVPPLVETLIGAVPVTLVTPPLPPPPQPVQVPVTVRLPVMVLPFTVKVPAVGELPKKLTKGVPLGASTSSVAAGVVVPMPTLTLVPLPTPVMAPSTRALLSATSALEPMAVAFVRVPVLNAAPAPTAVLLLVVMLE